MRKMEITPHQNLILARTSEQIIAASMNAKSLVEGDYPAVTYIPLDNTLCCAHIPSDFRTECEFKGTATYFSVNDQPNKAWIYFDPKDDVFALASHVSYYSDTVKIEEIALPPLDDDAAAVIKFWFEETPPELHYAQNDDLDNNIRTRFLPTLNDAANGKLDHWRDHPLSALALIILLDQFSRNLYRGTAAAYANDEKALTIAEEMIARGFDLALPVDQRTFVYLPHMHSEDLDVQNRCVELFTARAPRVSNIAFAYGHRDDIHRYGRFPYRDKALGR